MSTKIYRFVIGTFTIVEGFEVVDILFEQNYLSASCFEKNGAWCVEILSDKKILDSDISVILENYKYTVLKSEELIEVNWLKRCFENFKPIIIGNFYLFGPHLRSKPIPKNKIALEIAAATAFGTGEHPTTNRCLAACQAFFDHKLHKTVLDIGCGSGILSIALAKLGSRDVVACDNDPEAVRVTIENIAINQVHHRVHVFQNINLEFSTRNYDFIVANIFSAPLASMSDAIFNSLNDKGILILSGFNSDDNTVAEKYEAVGMTIIYRYNLDGWSTIVLQK